MTPIDSMIKNTRAAYRQRSEPPGANTGADTHAEQSMADAKRRGMSTGWR